MPLTFIKSLKIYVGNLYKNNGVIVKAGIANSLSARCEGACRVTRVWGSGEEWCILDEKEWTLA